MTANRAEPANAPFVPPEAVPNRAEPARGSRGRHAGPAVAVQPGLAMARAVGTGRWRGALAVLRANPLATAGAAIVIAVAAFCFLGPLVYHSNETRVLLSQGNLSPRPGHPLGTDADGLDELGQVMAGGQVSLELGLAVLVEGYAARGQGHLPHEEAVRDLLLERSQLVEVADVTGAPWIEIDFPGDVIRATEQILPRLEPSEAHGS